MREARGSSRGWLRERSEAGPTRIHQPGFSKLLPAGGCFEKLTGERHGNSQEGQLCCRRNCKDRFEQQSQAPHGNPAPHKRNSRDGDHGNAEGVRHCNPWTKSRMAHGGNAEHAVRVPFVSRWSDREAVQQQIDNVLESSEAGTLEAEDRKARALRQENARRVAVAAS